MSRRFLLAAVLIGGICTLGIELSASRLLAPYFGTSQLIWANVIGLTLIYLTAGYTFGGRLADRRPDDRVLAGLMLIAGLWTALIPLLSRPILHWSTLAFTTLSAGVLFGSLFGVLVLFAVPVILLGMISPFAIRLSVRDLQSAGRTAGSLSALSTLGSIIGTFLPVLLLIPWLGTSLTFYCFALALVLTGAIGLRRPIALLAVPAVVALAVFQLGVKGIREPFDPRFTSITEKESFFNYIQVAKAPLGPDQSEQIGLILNEGQAIHSIYNTRYGTTHKPADLLTGGPWDFFSVAPFFYPDRSKADVRSMMLIGSAAGTIPKQFLAFFGKDRRVDGVELDPAIVDVGRKYFAMDDGTAAAPNFRVHEADGRIYLAHSKDRYDIIGMDAYRQPYIPFHLTTKEFFVDVKAHLTDRGVAVVNAGKPGTDYRLVSTLANTMKAVFPQVFILDVPTFGNSIIVGVGKPVGDGVGNFRRNMDHLDDPVLQELMAQALSGREPGKLPLREWTDADVAGARPFTDDWAPVEWVIDRIIVRAATEGTQ
ncbi:MAG: fused MFS/spermidine synthase [Herpetosiphon sp.]